MIAARILRLGLWALLCIAIVFGLLGHRSADPWILSYSVIHVATFGAAVLAMLCGTRAIFGSPSRAWDVTFAAFAIVPAISFGAKGILIRRELGLGEAAIILLAAVAVVRVWRPRLPNLDMSIRDAAKVGLVNVAVVMAFLFALEGFVRLFLTTFDPANAENARIGNPFWFQYQPFLMHSMEGPIDIHFKNGPFFGDAEMAYMKTNNMGFRMANPVLFDLLRPKASNERVVLFTGGSAAWGVGASSNETTIAARLQATLNEAQTTYHYVVISLSSGGWVAFQSVLAITLYGPNFDPDWVVSMDGNNDVVVACSEGHGAGRIFVNQLEQYYRSYLYHHRSPSFYRGTLENALVRVSALYRLLTGLRYVPPPSEPSAKWEEVERSLAFYDLAYDRLFRVLATSKVKMLLSSQPYRYLNRADFDISSEDLHEIARRYMGTDCRKVPHLEMNRYFHPRLKLLSQELVARWNDRLDVRYLNIGELLPQDPQARLDFWWNISPVHLSDRGQDFVANIYARAILDADLAHR
jgi:hypothetical protein